MKSEILDFWHSLALLKCRFNCGGKMKTFCIKTTLICVFFSSFIGCGQDVAFDKSSERATGSLGDVISPPPIVTSFELEDTFTYSGTNDLFHQETYEKNKTVLLFRALDRNGKSIKDLKKSDLSIKENSKDVSTYELNSDSMNTGQKVDIVFALDITGSMDAEINSVKQNVSKFVADLEAKKVSSSLCLVTYKDKVERKCDRFVMDDPSTPENENLVDFLDEVSKLEARGGGRSHENTMGAVLTSAESTPWNLGTQRMIIFFTDDGFWIKPRDDGRSEAKTAPTYIEVLDALTDKDVQVFGIATDHKGYKNDYDIYPSVTEHSGGAWFDIDKLRRGKITIDDIFNYINDQISTTYTITYNVEDNSLDPTLPIDMRDFKIASKGSVEIDKIVIKDAQSNMPNGRPELKARWVLNKNSPINVNSVKVKINGSTMAAGFQIDSGEIVFNSPPAQGAKIEVQYELGTLIDNISTHPIVLEGNGSLGKTSVYFNHILANKNEYEITPSHDGTLHFKVSRDVLTDPDTFGIRAQKRLKIEVQYERVLNGS